MWLQGLAEIGAYVRRHPSTVTRWHRQNGFPICHLPNGVIATSTEAIAQWIIARSRAERRKYGKFPDEVLVPETVDGT